ncbi:MAG: DUF1295 domain-containing protein [Sphingomonadaceae bacterium]|nr:DUF1295 domain-containing protein [Sphingomonadaceae bacterium]
MFIARMSGVGVAGLAGLALAVIVGRWTGANGPLASMCAVVACGLPMVLWSVFVDKVWKNPSTGLDWARPLRAHDETREISMVKLAGLWATWGAIGAAYCIGRWYWDGSYLFAMRILAWSVPFLIVASVPYIFWIDRRLSEPKDGAYAFGAWLLGREGADRDKIVEHWRSWTIKGFFLAFMISIVPGNWRQVIETGAADIVSGPVSLAAWLVGLLFLIDVTFATVGYALTVRPLDSHIRSGNPFVSGWVAALICYPPFILMNGDGPLDYHQNTAQWDIWFAGYPVLLWAFGAVLVLLTAIYAWATVAFGIRFSNLTHRGILTHGPYRWTRHPAYLSKNAFWWISTLPFLAVSGNPVDMVRNTAILAVISAIYYWRARTEEAHLMPDPDYRAYHEWMERNGLVPRFVRWLTEKRPAVAVAAE